MLYAIVFTCGSALMGLELVATRVLAPFLGNSIFVWGSVISVVMIALSVGYWLGGQIADRLGAQRMLAPVIALAGLLTTLAPAIAKAVLPGAAELGPRLGSLTAAGAVFFAPGLLLAIVSPLGVRIAANAGLARIGRSAGGLYAISTAGSIVGTLATAFWLIPALSLEPLTVGIGFALMGTALLSLTIPRLTRIEAEGAEPAPSRARLAPTAIAVTLLAVAAGAVVGGYVLARIAPPETINTLGEKILFRKDTQYHRITVTEDQTQRHLRFDRSHQSAMYLSDPYSGSILYPNYLHLALALKPNAKRVLVLGLGGGTVTKRYWHDYPDINVDTVEIDPAVIDVAKRYFDLPTDSRIRIFNEDARRYVQKSTETYDIVIVDCYYADSLPFHLTTDEFFREVKAHLSPDGVIAYNCIGSVEGDSSRLFRSMYRTASGVWSNTWAFPIGIGRDGLRQENRNIIVLASDTNVSRDELLRRIASRVDGRVSVPGFASFGKDLYTGQIDTSGVPLLTDSHAPTDSLIHVN
jgi:spermidine synthase